MAKLTPHPCLLGLRPHAPADGRPRAARRHRPRHQDSAAAAGLSTHARRQGIPGLRALARLLHGAKSRGECPFVAIPVALSKIFRHSCIYVRTDAGIASRRTCAASGSAPRNTARPASCSCAACCSTTTASASEDMHWFMGGLNTFVEPPLIPLNLPNNIRLDFLAGGRRWRRCSGRRTRRPAVALYPNLFLQGSPHIARLFPNYRR